MRKTDTKEIVVATALLVALAFVAIGLQSCTNSAGKVDVAETIITGYETVTTLGYPTVLVYLKEREKNGSLAADQLAKYKAQYVKARGYGLDAGDVLKAWMSNSQPSALINFPILLRQAAILLADLSGGKVEEKNGRLQVSLSPDFKLALDRETEKFGYTFTPEQITLAVNTILAAAQLIINQTGAMSEIPAEQKLLYIERIDLAQKSIPLWE